MKKYILLFFFLVQGIYAEPLEDYYTLIKQHPKLISKMGNYTQGEIEIILDPIKIQKVESLQTNRLLNKGFSDVFSKQAAKVGVVFEDPYWLIIRDAVMFPSGHMGTYNRLILKSSLEKDSNAGVAILPELEDGKVILVLQYRHATRSWELEIPRGFKDEGESILDAAKREMLEETGCLVNKISFLGKMIVDSGLVNSSIPVFSAKVQKIEQAKIEWSEAILSNVILTKKEVEEGLLKGFIEIEVQNRKKRVSVKDSYLSYAVLQKMLQKTW